MKHVVLRRFVLIECSSPYRCGQKFARYVEIVVDPRVERVPIIDRALATAGWVTVETSAFCPECFELLEDDIIENRDEFVDDVELALNNARSVRDCLQAIEVVG